MQPANERPNDTAARQISHAPQGRQASPMTAMLRQAGGYDAQVQMLAPKPSAPGGEAAAMPSTSEGGRVTGVAADVLASTFGEPPWQVQSTKDAKTLDRMKVLKHEARPANSPPGWYGGVDGARTLAHYERVSAAQSWGGWPASLKGRAGVFQLGWVDEPAGVGHFFGVDYAPPRAKTKSEETHDQLRDEGGGMTVQYGAYRSMEFLSGVVNFFNPADNIIQGVTGRDLDPFGDDFGKKLSVDERALQLIQAASEAYGASQLGQLSKPELIALGISCIADAGVDPIVGTLEDMKLVDAQGAALMRAIAKLAGLSGQFAKLRGGAALDDLDYLATIATLASLGEDAIERELGEQGYEQFWKPNYGAITQVVTNADKLGGAAQLFELARAFKR